MLVPADGTRGRIRKTGFGMIVGLWGIPPTTLNARATFAFSPHTAAAVELLALYKDLLLTQR